MLVILLINCPIFQNICLLFRSLIINVKNVDVHFQQYFKYSMKVFGLKTRKIFYLHALALGIPALQRGIFPEKKKKENIFGKLLPLPEVNKSTRCIFQAHYHHERKTDKQLGIISCSFIY